MRFAAISDDLMELFRVALTDERVSASKVWEDNIRERSQYLLDPVALAAAYGSPQHHRIAQAAASYEALSGGQMVDAGAAQFDTLFRKLGLNTNLAGVSKPPTVYYPIAEDVFYKRQYKAPGGFKYKYKGEPGTIVEYLNLTNTPMADWDLPGPDHATANVTVQNLGDVEEIAREYVRRHPSSQLRLYQTPGGFRAWELGERMTPSQFGSRFNELNVDPDYALLTGNSIDRISEWQSPSTSKESVPFDPPGFRSRISHKPGRVDWVAQPLVTIAGKESLADPRSRFLVNRLHDQPIRRAYLNDTDRPGISSAAMQALARQLPTASSSLRRRLKEQFGLS